MWNAESLEFGIRNSEFGMEDTEGSAARLNGIRELDVSLSSGFNSAFRIPRSALLKVSVVVPQLDGRLVHGEMVEAEDADGRGREQQRAAERHRLVHPARGQ